MKAVNSDDSQHLSSTGKLPSFLKSPFLFFFFFPFMDVDPEASMTKQSAQVLN